jgi:hypothetical protein
MADNANIETEKAMELEEDCTSTASDGGEGVLDAEQMTAQVADLQRQLDALRFRSLKARAEFESLDPAYKSDQFYPKEGSTAEQLNALTCRRTKTCLNYCTLQDALRGSEAVKALKAGLDLLDEKEKGDITTDDNDEGDEIKLEPEERDYVLELINEERELSKELTDKSKTCIDQEVEIIQSRREVAENLCKISDLWGRITECGTTAHVKDADLQQRMKVEEAKLNQMRLMIQRLMMGENQWGQIFDPQTNKRFKAMFYKCGLRPEQLIDEEKMDLTPQVS